MLKTIPFLKVSLVFSILLISNLGYSETVTGDQVVQTEDSMLTERPIKTQYGGGSTMCSVFIEESVSMGGTCGFPPFPPCHSFRSNRQINVSCNDMPLHKMKCVTPNGFSNNCTDMQNMHLHWSIIYSAHKRFYGF